MGLEELRARILSCSLCHLRASATRPVPGEGTEEAWMMLVGEAPGRQEDLLGRPFVGRAGRLLRTYLKILDIPSDKVYITNVVKCRPPKNRTPTMEEMNTCGRFLLQEISIVDPKVIVALGRVPTAFFMSKSVNSVVMSRIRGKTFAFRGRVVYPTYHPAAVLRNPTLGDMLKEDLKKAREIAKNAII